MFERFDEDARKALFLARVAASERHGNSIELRDLLLGVTLLKPAAVLDFATRGFTTASVTNGDTVEDMVARLDEDEALDDATSVEMPFETSVKQALQRAVEEADALDHATIRPEHLILGILGMRAPPHGRHSTTLV
jgi:ATP-dependent Clp protease ATP-binding subunit ClpA